MYRILVLNPGSTSTKTAVYEDKKCIAEQSIAHSKEENAKNNLAHQQVEMRAECVLSWLKNIGIDFKDIDAIAARGCVFKDGQSGGTYLVNENRKDEIYTKYFPYRQSNHAARLALPIAYKICEECGVDKPVYITDPPCVNELEDIAKLSGHPLFEKESVFHALLSRGVAYKAAEELGKEYKDSRLIVICMGGGISVAAHIGGKAVEVNDCFFGAGPFSPNRSGTLPVGALVDACFSGEYTREEVRLMISGNGGIKAYLGTEDLREVEERIKNGDKEAEKVFKALCYQIAKEIGSCYAAMCGEADALVFTGGMANSKLLMSEIGRYVSKFAPVMIINDGDFEAQALAYGALRVLTGEAEPIVL